MTSAAQNTTCPLPANNPNAAPVLRTWVMSTPGISLKESPVAMDATTMAFSAWSTARTQAIVAKKTTYFLRPAPCELAGHRLQRSDAPVADVDPLGVCPDRGAVVPAPLALVSFGKLYHYLYADRLAPVHERQGFGDIYL